MRRLLTILQIMALMVAVMLIVGAPAGKSPKIVFAAGTYVSAPTLPGGTINFTTSQIPDFDTQTFTITDGGGSPPNLLVTDIQLTSNPGGVYSLDIRDPGNNPVVFPTNYDVTATGPLTVNITCQNAVGNAAPFATTLNVSHNDPPSPAAYNLSCIVNPPSYSSTPAVNPANPANPVNINTDDETPAGSTIQINNVGAGDLRITNIQLTGDTTHLSLGFGGLPITVAPAGNTVINVNCNPNDDDFTQPSTIYNGTVAVTHDDQTTPGVPQPIVQYPVACNVTGTPDMSSNPAPAGVINVGSALVGVQVNNNTALEIQNNVGSPAFVNGNLSVTNMTFTGGNAGDFSFLTPTNFTVPENNTSNVGIRCIPSAAAPRTTTLNVFHNDNVLPSPTTYTVNCTGLAPQPIYVSNPLEPNPPQVAGQINFGTGIVGQPIALATALTITNNGSAVLTINPITVTGGNAGDFTINTGFPIFVNPGNNISLSVTCTPGAVGARVGFLNVGQDDVTSGVPNPAIYQMNCSGSTTAPGYGSTPNPGVQLNINTTTNTTGTVNLTVMETGNQDLTVTGATIGGAQFSVSAGGGGFTIPNGGANQNIGVSCLSATAGTFNSTLTVNHNASGSPATYPVQCIVTGASGAGYSSNPSPGSTITINTPLNTTGTSTIVISETGTANLNITNIVEAGTATQISSTGPTLPITIVDNSGTTATETISCLSSTAGTFTETLTVTHNAPGSPAVYTINCTVSSATATTIQSATDTAATSTASAAVPATSVTQCPNNQVLSTPFPGNASGEYLLVNCFVISSQGTVSITLALVLTNPSSFVGADDIAAIQASPANMLVYRQGSWFLTPSTYNAATQTYSFTSAAGANIYGFFFGTITEPVGTQGTSAFAGTTTGNVEDAVEVIAQENRPPLVALIFSTAFVLFVGAIFFSRRYKKSSTIQSA